MTSLYGRLLSSPNGPAHIVGLDGTHEFSRVDFELGHFQFGWGNDKLGGAAVLAVDVDDGGVVMECHDGRRVFVPMRAVASLTYKYA